MNNSKPQTRRKDIAASEEKKPAAKKSPALKKYAFVDGVKVDAKNYGDALEKHDKMIKKAPMSKSVDGDE